mmetsp:Transcript_8555/g.28180  ORF Transcript_8555/g.28180 Transcript_8555/m.28180 type:complete len:396 (+) Transcript_8555:1409-2596(+)
MRRGRRPRPSGETGSTRRPAGHTSVPARRAARAWPSWTAARPRSRTNRWTPPAPCGRAARPRARESRAPDGTRRSARRRSRRPESPRRERRPGTVACPRPAHPAAPHRAQQESQPPTQARRRRPPPPPECPQGERMRALSAGRAARAWPASRGPASTTAARSHPPPPTRREAPMDGRPPQPGRLSCRPTHQPNEPAPGWRGLAAGGWSQVRPPRPSSRAAAPRPPWCPPAPECHAKRERARTGDRAAAVGRPRQLGARTNREGRPRATPAGRRGRPRSRRRRRCPTASACRPCRRSAQRRWQQERHAAAPTQTRAPRGRGTGGAGRCRARRGCGRGRSRQAACRAGATPARSPSLRVCLRLQAAHMRLSSARPRPCPTATAGRGAQQPPRESRRA